MCSRSPPKRRSTTSVCLPSADGDVNQADGLLFRATARTGDSGDAETEGRRRITANAFGQGPGYFLADRAVGLDQRRRNTGEESFELVAVNHRSP